MGSFIRVGPRIDAGEQSSCGGALGAWSWLVYLNVVTMRTRIPKLTNTGMGPHANPAAHAPYALQYNNVIEDSFLPKEFVKI